MVFVRFDDEHRDARGGGGDVPRRRVADIDDRFSGRGRGAEGLGEGRSARGIFRVLQPILEFPLESDQFFVLGDNSAASKDGRLWIDVHYVERRLLLGRAISIVWPHMVTASRHVTVTLPILGELRLPSWPNFARMKFIR